MLEKHRHSSHNDPSEHGHGRKESRDGDELELKGVPGRLLLEVGEPLSKASLLELRLGLDLEEFELKKLVVGWEIAEIHEHLTGFFVTTVVDEPTGREWHPDHADEEADRRGNLKADGDEPGGIGLCLEGRSTDEVAAVVDPEADHDSKGDGELLQSDKSSTNLSVKGVSCWILTDGNEDRLTGAHTRSCRAGQSWKVHRLRYHCWSVSATDTKREPAGPCSYVMNLPARMASCPPVMDVI